MSNSTVQFPTEQRVHITLAVSNLKKSAEFYLNLFRVFPTKTRESYARFEVVEPPLNLSLIESAKANGHSDPISHFGIQLKSAEALASAKSRVESLGLATQKEESVNCCHAVQDKFWIVDPDGFRWEFFVVLEDNVSETSEEGQGSTVNESEGICCPTSKQQPCCPC
ncbi:MAG: ArsI/CadI family heavy metal resistance metalloenzyme [Planctomycetota bacterium]